MSSRMNPGDLAPEDDDFHPHGTVEVNETQSQQAEPDQVPLLQFTQLLDLVGDWRNIAKAAAGGQLQKETAAFAMLAGAVKKLDERLTSIEIVLSGKK